MLSENDGEKLASINQIKYFHQSPVIIVKTSIFYVPHIEEACVLEGEAGTQAIDLFFVDVTQDIASKGLGMIYEISSSQQKDSLVSELVETLTTGKRSVV